MAQVEVLQTPVKSEGDKKDYRLIKLPNGLRALLISKTDDEGSTKSEDIAAACLAVNVGSFDDPKKVMGLAHFLEHMLFLGSEKYPIVSSFNDFLVANGGNDNAETTSECTKFYFHIDDKVLPKALDMFAQQFISPLLLKEALQREREAVDSEFQMASSQDQLLIENIYKNLINDSHPASQFEVGNLKTLKTDISDDDLHVEVLKFHAKYVASKMNLAVQSKRSLDEIQELVVSNFLAMRSTNESEIEEKTKMSLDEIFKNEFFDKIYFMKPKSSKKSLHLTWALPSVQSHYKTSPLEYISQIFSSERDGGIAKYLREQKFMTNIQCYTHISGFGGNSLYCMPRLIIELTDLGHENLNQVLAAIFSYLLMIKESPIEEHRRLFNDIKEKHEIIFKFHKEITAKRAVKDVVMPMILYDDEDILRGMEVFKEFNEEVILDVINSMNQMKFNILILNNEHTSYNKREKYFGTEYDQQDFPEEFKSLWNERSLNPIFFLEKPNPFKATNFEIYVNDDESPKYPVKILDDPVYEVWHKLDKTFKMPRASVHIYFLSPKAMTSIQSFLLLSIYDSMLTRRLRKITSESKNAGLVLNTKSELKALSFKFTGFNDKMETFVEDIMEEMKTFIENMDRNVFDVVKNHFRKHFRDSLMKGKYLCDEIFYEIVKKEYFTDFELLDELDKVSFENLENFLKKFFQNMKIQVLVQGNLTKAHTLKIVNILQSKLPCEAIDEEFELLPKHFALSTGSNVVRAKSLRANDDNSYTEFIYQVVDVTLRTRSLCQLLASILDPKAFNYLRNEEQLGYSVGVRYVTSVEIVALVVHVASQERKHLFNEVESKIETFIRQIAKKVIADLTDEEFENFKEARIKSLLANFSSAEAEANSNWKEVTQQSYVFDRYELSANVTKDLTKQDLQEFFISTTQENSKELRIAIIGDSKQSDRPETKINLLTEKLTDEENLITNLEEFQSRLELQTNLKFR